MKKFLSLLVGVVFVSVLLAGASAFLGIVKADSALAAGNEVITGVKVNPKESIVAGDMIEVAPVGGEGLSGVEYKYVWSYNNWKEWGVISGFTDNKSVKFKAVKPGRYDFYIDARKNGKVSTKSAGVQVSHALSGVNVSSQKLYAGNTVTVSPKLLKQNADVDFKYVWSYNDWQEWGIISNFSKNKTVQFRAAKPGKYDVYIDARQGGVVLTKSAKVETIHVLSGAQVSAQKVYAGDSITVSPTLYESASDVEFKYVWSYNNWKEWGVIKSGSADFSTAQSKQFKTTKVGKYDFYVDARMSGVVSTKTASVQVLPIAAGIDVSPQVSVVGFEGKTITITPKAAEARSGLRYKYVWQRNDWSEWGVIKSGSSDFSTDKSKTFEITKPGVYEFIVDFDNNGVYTSSKKTMKIVSKGTQATSFKGLTEAQAVAKIGPLMTEDQRNSGILASISTAQFILESGYGTTDLAQNANNCFGMKTELSNNSWTGSTWDGKSTYTKVTWEEYTPGVPTNVTATFRKYPCIEDSIADHSAYLLGAKRGSALRYPGLKGCKDYRRAAQIIKDGGYATDSQYVDKICNIIERWNLTKYDLK